LLFLFFSLLLQGDMFLYFNYFAHPYSLRSNLPSSFSLYIPDIGCEVKIDNPNLRLADYRSVAHFAT
jgi:hypothetical protein